MERRMGRSARLVCNVADWGSRVIKILHVSPLVCEMSAVSLICDGREVRIYRRGRANGIELGMRHSAPLDGQAA